MKKIFKWLGIVLLGLVLIATGIGLYLTNKADKLMAQKFDIDPPVFKISDDSLSLVKGKKLSTLCTECHGKNFEGYAFFNDPKLGILYAPNLTKGKGSAIDYYNDKDWIKAIRHGVRPNGEGLLVMPSNDFNFMSEEDISALIAYMKSVPPVNHETGKNEMFTFGKILLALGAFGEVNTANLIDHSKPPSQALPAGVTVDYGAYMVNISGCKTCHGEHLQGGKHPDPNSPLVPNLRQNGNLKNWSNQDFLQTIKTGKTPEGKQMNAKYMPYPSFAGLSETDLLAIFIYLKSLPKLKD